jgi:hypothetical protein
MLKILLLCDFQDNSAGTILDHIHSFVKFSQNEYVIRSGRGDLLSGLNLEVYDGLIIHYSLVACLDSYVLPSTRRSIRLFQGYKAAFVQDDYRFINATCDALNYMQIHALFALPGMDIIDKVYSLDRLPSVKKFTTLTGYVSDGLIGIETQPYELRKVDVSYRARKVPPWIGEHSLQKWQIAEKFKADAANHYLKIDISCEERDRLYGDDWKKLLINSKAVLGTESGASVTDFTGEIQRNVEKHLELDPNANFEELRDLYFKDNDGKIIINVISPRCFEAAALKTLMIMYEGHYSGVLEPWKHYVPLKKDHSNINEVIAILRNPERAEMIIESAYKDLILSNRYSYRAMMSEVDGAMKDILALGLKPSPMAENPINNPPKFSFARLIDFGYNYCNYQWLKLWRALYPTIIVIYPYLRHSDRVYRFYRLIKRSICYLQSFNSWYMNHFDFWQLYRIRQFYQGKNDVELHLEFAPASGLFMLVGRPVGSKMVATKHKIELSELKERILIGGEAKNIWWLNRDIYGIGIGSPLPLKHHFKDLSWLMQNNPKKFVNLFFDRRADWYCSISLIHSYEMDSIFEINNLSSNP